jgi:hypothetical protein
MPHRTVKLAKSKVLHLDQWDRHAEEVAAHPGVISIGDDALLVTGLTGAALGQLIRERLCQMTDGAHLLTLTDPQGREHRLYARRRGRCVDAGTRKDFAQPGWEQVCDFLDAQHEQNGSD